MDFLIGPMKQHLNGHKELTAHGEVVRIMDVEKVYIPLVQGPAKIDVLVSEGDTVCVGTLIAKREDHFYVPMFASVSGKVIGIEKRMHSSLKMVDHLVIENDQQYTVAANLSTLDYTSASEDEIASFIKEKGLVGQGGAGFPTYVKYQNVKGCERLIINAVECEPYITADYVGLDMYMDDFKQGTLALLKASKAPVCLVAIKDSKKEMIAKLQATFKDCANVEIAQVPDVYPMGWERTLIYQLTKKRYEKLPIEVGCVVSNETTAIALGKAMRTGVPIGEKMITVSGDGIKSPANVICPVGTVAKEIIDRLGGVTAEEIQLIAGGPMMGTAMTSDQIVVGYANNALTILKYQEVNEINCLRCGACVDYCPSALQPVNINNAEKAKNVDRLITLKTDQCIECGMCTYVCPSKIAVTEGVRRAKRYLALRKK